MSIKFALAAVAMVAMAPQQNGAYPGWLTSTAQAFQQARQTGKPLFIVFR